MSPPAFRREDIEAASDAFFNPRGLRLWLLAEERELALERQADEHHRSEAELNHSESLFGRARGSCATASSAASPRP